MKRSGRLKPVANRLSAVWWSTCALTKWRRGRCKMERQIFKIGHFPPQRPTLARDSAVGDCVECNIPLAVSTFWLKFFKLTGNGVRFRVGKSGNAANLVERLFDSAVAAARNGRWKQSACQQVRVFPLAGKQGRCPTFLCIKRRARQWETMHRKNHLLQITCTLGGTKLSGQGRRGQTTCYLFKGPAQSELLLAVGSMGFTLMM